MAEIYIKTYDNVADPRLGRIVHHDERSKAYRAVVSPVEVKNVRWTRVSPVFDQGQLGSCTGNAGVGCTCTTPFATAVLALFQQQGTPVDEDLAIKVYSEATKVDDVTGEYPPTDTGSSGLAVAKVLKKMGVISGYTHAFGFDELVQALQSGPCIVGVNWYQGFFTPDANGIVNFAPNDQVAGGHEFVLDEVDVDRQLIGATNSWGTGWGLAGRFYIPFAVMKRLLDEQGDVTVFVPIDQPAPTPQPVPTPPAPTPAPPTPSPTPVDVDKELWAATSEWSGKRHSGSNRLAAQAVLAWAKEKGLTVPV